MAAVDREDVVMSWAEAARLADVPLGEIQSLHEFADYVLVTLVDGRTVEAKKGKSAREAAEVVAANRELLAMHPDDSGAVPRIAVAQAPTPDTGKRDPGQARPEAVVAVMDRPHIEDIDVRTGAELNDATGTPILDPKAAARAEREAARALREEMHETADEKAEVKAAEKRAADQRKAADKDLAKTEKAAEKANDAPTPPPVG